MERRLFLGTTATALAAGAFAPGLRAASARDALAETYGGLIRSIRVAGRLLCPPGSGFGITLDPKWLAAAQVL